MTETWPELSKAIAGICLLFFFIVFHYSFHTPVCDCRILQVFGIQKIPSIESTAARQADRQVQQWITWMG